MIKLYGLKISNYYNLNKALMHYKGIEYEEIKAPPSQKEGYLSRSPMGKMPSIEVDGRFLSESLAIASYLDRMAPEPALLPQDPFNAAKVIELVCHLKLDVELVARRCLPEAFFGQTVSDETKEQTKADLEKGIKAVQRLMVCNPYAAGSELTLADFYAFYCLGLSGMIAQTMFNMDLLADYPETQALMGRLAELPCIAEVEAAKAA